MKKILLSSLCVLAALSAKGDDFEVGEFGHSPISEYISRFIHTIPSEVHADSEDSDEICYEIAHTQSISS